jgi:hypothetical protein
MENQQMETIYKKNQAVLKEIENNVPERLKSGLMKKIMNTEQEDTAKETLKRTDLSPELRSKIETDLTNGVFRFEEEIVDEEIEKELDAYYEKEVKAAIADGRLTSPDEDPFYQKMVAKIDELKNKKNENNI